MLLFVVPTGDVDAPVSIELGCWDSDKSRFEGEWRYVEGLEHFDPIAWAPAPKVDSHIIEEALEFARKRVA